MSTHDHGSEVGAEAIEYPVWWEAEQSDLLRGRKAEQVRLIVAAFEAAGTPVGIYPSDDRPEDMEYMYRKGYLLTRDADVRRVHDALDREPGFASKTRTGLPAPISGLTSCR